GTLSIKSSKNLNDAVTIMADFDVGSLLVANNGDAVGIITSKDIIKVISHEQDLKKVKVKDVMQTPIIKIKSVDTISSALLKMKEQKINHLIVVDGNKIVGMVNPLNLLI
ncbi:MAG: CBS domain-containing protein, partial [Candidatus Heimdallarchaeaceae archaeon]